MVPRYDDLIGTDNQPEHSTWGLFGTDDEIGALNLLGPQRVIDAAALVRTGRVFPLNWDIDQPSPAILGRTTVEHVVLTDPTGKDDYYNSFYPQASSQWDALCHVRHPRWGFYNGVPDNQTPGLGGYRLGIDKWSRRGIVGRFVLADVARNYAEQGRPIDASTPLAVNAKDLESVLASQGLSAEKGDILLIRFGWLAWYRRLGAAERAALGGPKLFPAPGLARDEDVARFLWDRGFVAVAGDCPALEAMPFDDTSEGGMLHYRLIPLLGMAIGELFDLDALAEDCARTGVYVGLLVSAPMQKVGGVGSPANAIAIK